MFTAFVKTINIATIVAALFFLFAVINSPIAVALGALLVAPAALALIIAIIFEATL